MKVGSGSAPSPEGFRGYIPELDIFRAFGVTAVILYHTWVYRPRFWNMLDVGWIIMDTFFVLSGFLIAGILLDTRSRPDYYWSFYTRRALRILPAYYLLISFLTLCSIFHGSGLLYPSDPALYKWGSPWWFFVYLGNLPVAITGQHPTAVRNCFVPLWSLQIEEQFYLLFPLLVRRLKLQTLAHTLLGLACFSMLLRVVLYWLFPANNLLEYVLLPCRMDGLALGAWVPFAIARDPGTPPKGDSP